MQEAPIAPWLEEGMKGRVWGCQDLEILRRPLQRWNPGLQGRHAKEPELGSPRRDNEVSFKSEKKKGKPESAAILKSAATAQVSRVMLAESESCSVVSDSLQPHGLFSPWNSLGQNTEVGSLSETEIKQAEVRLLSLLQPSSLHLALPTGEA